MDEADQMLKLGFKEDVERVRIITYLILTLLIIDSSNHQRTMQTRLIDMPILSYCTSMVETCGSWLLKEKL